MFPCCSTCITTRLHRIRSSIKDFFANTPLLPLLFIPPTLLVITTILSTLTLLTSSTPHLPPFFLRLDLRNLFPSDPTTTHSLGLPDFYQIGLLSYCSGDFLSTYPSRDSATIEKCSTPKYPFWPNPLEVIQTDLLSGAVIVLPEEAETALTILRKVAKTNTNLHLATLAALILAFMTSLPVVGWGLFFHFRRRRSSRVKDGESSELRELRVHTSWTRAYRSSKILIPPAIFFSALSVVISFTASTFSTAIFYGASIALRKAVNGTLPGVDEKLPVSVWADVGGALGMSWGVFVGCVMVGGVWWWIGWRVWRKEARVRRVGESADQSGVGSEGGSVVEVGGGKGEKMAGSFD